VCGIAGYNVSEEWREKYISPEIQKAVLQEAWLHNLHRGSDAAGYFALKDDNNYKVYKQNSDAATLLNKNLKYSELPPARVFGAHTRAMTKGDAKVKANNHPVFYDGIWVTHNGTIRNDEEIKKTVEASKRKSLAEVDSIAIPIRLSKVETPLNVEHVTDAMSGLFGGYAFHAVWRAHPGVSVLARGNHSPLIVAQHKFGAIFYASEVEALWGMIGAMKLDPADKAWDYYSFHEKSVAIVENGVPVAWADYEDELGTDIVSRVLPKGRDGKAEIVYTSKGKYDFAQKTRAAGRDLNKVENIEPVYTLGEGHIDVKDRFPRTSDTDVFSVTSEADRIIRNKVSDNLHVFFGDIEIIMSGRVVLDIYDHSKFKTEDRWFVDPKIIPTLDTFDDFLKEKSTAILQTPDLAVGYKYDKKQQPLPLGQGGKADGTPNGGKRQLTSKTAGLKLVRPDPVLNWTNVWNIVQEHKNLSYAKDGFIFSNNNLRCQLHGDVLMQDHPMPTTCGYAKASAAYTLSCAADLEIMTALMPNAIIREKSARQICEKGQHDIMGTVYFEVILSSDRFFEILIEEECMDCGTTWELDNIPFWVLNVVGGKKDLMVGYGTR
jgi:hypothetical protein